MTISPRSLAFFPSLVWLAACAPTAPSAGTDSGSTIPRGDGGAATGDFTCCVNGAGYRCPSDAAVRQCGGFDPSCFSSCTSPECFQHCSDLQASAMPDPSACTADATVTCGSIGCVRGDACTLDSDCSTGNCTDGACYGNEVGCACTLDDDCTSGNCTNGTCEGNGVGSPCTLDDDCTSSNCTNGTCEGNGVGSPCTLDDDCTSSNCTDGHCA